MAISSLRSTLLLLAGLSACAIFPKPGPGGGGSVSPPKPPVEATHPWLAGLRLPPQLERPPRDTEEQLAEDIEALLEGDFEVYPEAASRLVDLGEVAVPYLGHAAREYPAPPFRKERIEIVLEPICTDLSSERVGACLVSPYAQVRIAGAASVGTRHLTEHAQRLVVLLDDEHVEVRRASVTALRRLSNAFFGYRPEDSASRRRAATEQWRELWRAG